MLVPGLSVLCPTACLKRMIVPQKNLFDTTHWHSLSFPKCPHFDVSAPDTSGEPGRGQWGALEESFCPCELLSVVRPHCRAQALLIFGVLPVGFSPPWPSPEAPNPTFLPAKGSPGWVQVGADPGCSPERRGVRWAARCPPWWLAFVSLFYPSGTWLLKIVQVWTGRCFICPLREDQN